MEVQFQERLPREKEFESLSEYVSALMTALDQQSLLNPEPCSSVFVVPFCELSEDRFFEEFAFKGHPVVLTNLPKPFAFESSVWKKEALLESCAEMPCTIRKGTCYETMESLETTYAEYLELISQADCDLYYGANNMLPPHLIPWLPLPPFFPRHTKRLLDTRLWIGPKSTGAPLHRDLQDNFLHQVFGEKLVFLIPPHCVDPSCAYSVTPFLQAHRRGLGVDGKLNSMLCLSSNCTIQEIVLHPGDMLFIPAGWWHSTVNTGSSLSCSVNYFLSACFASLRVVVPDIASGDWLLEPGTRLLEDGHEATKLD
jgi:hypothetical protein